MVQVVDAAKHLLHEGHHGLLVEVLLVDDAVEEFPALAELQHDVVAPPRGSWAGREGQIFRRRGISAGSTATIATKYSFFQVFRDLQNYLTDFLKKLQILHKIAKFAKILRNFRIFAKKSADYLRKSLIFCRICKPFEN